MNRTIRIYLAHQRIADGRVQIRRWSPDRVSTIGKAGPLFLGFERQSSQATAWLAANGEPTWPQCLAAALPAEPYCVSNNGDDFKAWEKGNSQRAQQAWEHFRKVGAGEIDENIGIYTTPVINEAAPVDESALAGVMRTLKLTKGVE